MSALEPYLTFITDHLYAVVFAVAMIDALALPVPGRLLLVTAGALSPDAPSANGVVLFAGAGAALGDHVLYLLGRLGGDKILRLYCRWSLGSARCVRKTEESFERFGPLTIVGGRFLGGVRAFAATLAGSGAVPYPRFLLFDVIGALLWAAVLVVVGYSLGSRAIRALESYGQVALVVGGVLLVAGAGIVAYRVWVRRHHGIANVSRPRPA